MSSCNVKFFLTIISFFFFFTLTAQENIVEATKTISVSGISEYRLSPDEIIIRISIEEYFTDPQESYESKVILEKIEVGFFTTLYKSIPKDKLTVGGINIIRPRKNSTYLKRRLSKSFYVCVSNNEELLTLTRNLENDGYFDKIISQYSIAEYRNKDKAKYLDQCKKEAYDNALNKAKAILATSGYKPGKPLKVTEAKAASTSTGGFYETTPQVKKVDSGFRPITTVYSVDVVFEIEKN